jgi:hypothetical protein
MLTAFLQFLQQTSVSALIANSRYGAMIIQTFHVLGFTLLLATVAAYNIRVQSGALASLSLRNLAHSLGRYYNTALVVALGAGFLLGMPRAEAYWGNAAFVYKLALLVPAIIVQAVLQNRTLATAEGATATAPLKAVAALSLVLWFAVGIAGRAIGFLA